MNLFKHLRLATINDNGKPMNIVQLSKKLGVSPACISKIERGMHIPTLEVIAAYKQYFGVSYDALFEATLHHFILFPARKQ